MGRRKRTEEETTAVAFRIRKRLADEMADEMLAREASGVPWRHRSQVAIVEKALELYLLQCRTNRPATA
jgi:hypothetical protein